jgi:hypothetical protein
MNLPPGTTDPANITQLVNPAERTRNRKEGFVISTREENITRKAILKPLQTVITKTKYIYPMVRASELRIGNYVNTPKGYQKVNAIGSGKMLSVEYGSVEYQELTPMPLTPEMLLKCGFNQFSTVCYQMEIENLSLEYFTDTKALYIYPNEGEIKIPMPYLHQLQNHYFALTYKELEINL